MPIDNLQRRVVQCLSLNRSPQNVFAGGSVLNLHSFRMSDDHDIFIDNNLDVISIANADINLLKANGFDCHKEKTYEGLVEYSVGTVNDGFTKVQWVSASCWKYFEPVPDNDFGWRLHYVDLSINKALAAATRHEIRDFVDLSMIDESIMPLWHVAWAAPGKDDLFTPLSIIKDMQRNCSFNRIDIHKIDTEIDIDVGLALRRVRSSLNNARTVIETLPPETAGRLFVDQYGDVITDINRISDQTVRAIEPTQGGAWPSTFDSDHAIIKRVHSAIGTPDQRIDAYNRVLAGDLGTADETSRDTIIRWSLYHALDLPDDDMGKQTVLAVARDISADHLTFLEDQPSLPERAKSLWRGMVP